eukprot:TRINITY_DN4287_c0_g1_i2.p1 TRINITY_DN4287_c0_g1~~TRINITY_DN4287_c0_g1_i2.p1  ORF type:complete len:213 (-),score=41.84 TRINITY_DN4287_c0_g1_i2:26-664(-)
MPLFKLLKKESSILDCKAKKKQQPDARSKLKHDFKATLGSGGTIKDSVKLPVGENQNEWIAMNTVELYNTINLCYGIIAEFCTDQSCPKMTAGTHVYLWTTSEKEGGVEVPAPEYIHSLFDWISNQIDDPEVFAVDKPFSKDFPKVVRKILNRMIRVYAHLYHAHYEKIQSLGAEAHLNTCFKHIYYFMKEFNMIDEKNMEPLEDQIKQLIE